MRVELVVTIMFLGTALTYADDTADTACLAAALSAYTKANSALMLRSVPVMSVEAIVAKRRLQEQYCLRVARCRVGDQNQGMAVLYATAFSSCLNDEAKEHPSR